MEETFIQKLAKQAKESKVIKDKDVQEKNAAFIDSLDELIKVYEPKIRESLQRSATHGHTTTYMNFTKEDFNTFKYSNGKEINYRTVCISMLNRMVGVNSEFKNLKFRVWNNQKFTVFFDFSE